MTCYYYIFVGLIIMFSFKLTHPCMLVVVVFTYDDHISCVICKKIMLQMMVRMYNSVDLGDCFGKTISFISDVFWININY